ncbi:MAG: TonB-dependent receptor [Pseudomonadota bacterium]
MVVFDQSRKRYPRRIPRPLVWLLLCISWLGGADVRGQTEADTAVFDFAIAAQPLGDALREYTVVTGLQVIVPRRDISSYEASALNGRLTAEEGLARMTAGSGLTVARVDGDTMQLRAADKPGASREFGAGRLEELIVYGTKANRTLQETSVSVELFTSERIEEEVLFSLDDILLRTPNVSMNNVQTGLSIRGIDQDGVGQAGAGQTSQIYIDGSPLSGTAQFNVQSTWDVSQVEVLRGPQSTTQGRNALAGAVVMRTEDPGYDWTAKGRLHVATEDTFKGSLAFGGPIIEDQLAFRVAYDKQDFETGLREVTTGDKQQFQNYEMIRGKLLLEPEAIPDLRIVAQAQYSESDFGDFNFAIAPVSFDDPAFEDFDPFGNETHSRTNFSDVETSRFILDSRYRISDHWNLIGLFTYEETEQLRESRFSLPETLGLPPSQTGGETEVAAAELRLEFDFERWSGWLGAYYYDEQLQGGGLNIVSFDFLGLPFPVDPPDSILIVDLLNRNSIENEAVFADFTYQISEKWALNFGARYDREERENPGTTTSVRVDPEDCVLAIPGAPLCSSLIPGQTQPASPAEFSAFLPRIGLTHRFDADRSVSFGVQRGYRAGGAQNIVEFATGGVTLNEFDAEFVTNYELAFRSQWWDRTLTINANVFYTEWEDQQVTVPGPNGDPRLSRVENAGESELYGLELSLFYTPSDNLSVFASLGLLETEFVDFPFAAVPGDLQNIAGNSFPFAPSVTGALGFNYEHASGVYTNWNVSYRGGQYSDVANLVVNEVGSYVLVNARLGYSRSNWNVFLYGNNLFDDRFATSRGYAFADTDTGLINVNDNAAQRINQPRIAGLAVEFAY